jgi:hypothetical protein
VYAAVDVGDTGGYGKTHHDRVEPLDLLDRASTLFKDLLAG